MNYLLIFLIACFAAETQAQELRLYRQLAVPLDDPTSLIRDFAFSVDGTLYYTQYAGRVKHEIRRVVDPLGIGNADCLTTDALYGNGTGNCLCVDDLGRIYLTSEEGKWIRRYLSSGELDGAFASGGEAKQSIYPRTVSKWGSDLAISGLSATNVPKLYRVDCISGKILETVSITSDKNDKGPGGAFVSDTPGAMTYDDDSQCLYVNCSADVVRVCRDGAGGSPVFNVVGFHGYYESATHGIAYNKALNILASTAAWFGQTSTRMSMMIWLQDLKSDKMLPIYPSLSSDDAAKLGKTIGTIRWMSVNGTHYLFIVNNDARLFNIYQYVPPQNIEMHLDYEKSIDVSGILNGSRIRSVVTLPDQSLLFSSFGSNAQNQPLSLTRVSQPLGTCGIGQWGNDTYPAVFNDMTVGNVGDVYLSLADQGLTQIRKYRSDGSLDTTFGIGGVIVTAFEKVGPVFAKSIAVSGDRLLVAHASPDVLFPDAVGLIKRLDGSPIGTLVPSIEDSNEDGALEEGNTVWGGMYHDGARAKLYANAAGSLIKISGIGPSVPLPVSMLPVSEFVTSHRYYSTSCQELAASADGKWLAYTAAGDKSNAYAISSSRVQSVVLGILEIPSGRHNYVVLPPTSPGFFNWGGSMSFFTDAGNQYLAVAGYFDSKINIYRIYETRPAEVCDWVLW